MRHRSHQVNKLILANKDDNATLEPSALVVRCALVRMCLVSGVLSTVSFCISTILYQSVLL